MSDLHVMMEMPAGDALFSEIKLLTENFDNLRISYERVTAERDAALADVAELERQRNARDEWLAAVAQERDDFRKEWAAECDEKDAMISRLTAELHAFRPREAGVVEGEQIVKGYRT